MPNPKKKPTTSPWRLWKKKQYIWLAVFVVLFGLVCYFSGRTYLRHQHTEAVYQQDKIRFAGAEKDMAAAYSAVVTSVGQPYETKITKGCGYGALKFARGPLSCGISYDYSYGTNSRADSKILGQKILAVINATPGFSNSHISYGNGDYAQEGGQYTEDFQDSNGLDCELVFNPYDGDSYNSAVRLSRFGEQSKLITTSFAPMTRLVCNRYTPKALYPIDKRTE